MRHRLFLLVTMAWAALPGQGVSLGWGRLHEVGAQDYTYTWQMQYFQPFGERWGATLGWLNEGHIPDHHRDGAEIQVWRTHRIPTNDLQLGLGLGAYYFFDTTKGRGEDPSVYQNRHGLKPLLSLRAQYPISKDGWAVFLQVNRTLDSNGPQTQAMLVGASFLFGPAVPEKRREPVALAKNGEEAQNELAMMFGRTILNSFESESTSLFDAYSVEYCRHISPDFAFELDAPGSPGAFDVRAQICGTGGMSLLGSGHQGHQWAVAWLCFAVGKWSQKPSQCGMKA